MKGAHSDELRQLAQAILDRIDPAVRLAVAAASGRGDGQGKCQQVWCPVCALGALVQGEQHPLLDVIAEHSVALLTVVRAMIDANGASPPPPDGGGPPSPPNGQAAPGSYQRIPITVEDS